jgi:hypothetical protein
MSQQLLGQYFNTPEKGYTHFAVNPVLVCAHHGESALAQYCGERWRPYCPHQHVLAQQDLLYVLGPHQHHGGAHEQVCLEDRAVFGEALGEELARGALQQEVQGLADVGEAQTARGEHGGGSQGWVITGSTFLPPPQPQHQRGHEQGRREESCEHTRDSSMVEGFMLGDESP